MSAHLATARAALTDEIAAATEARDAAQARIDRAAVAFRVLDGDATALHQPADDLPPGATPKPLPARTPASALPTPRAAAQRRKSDKVVCPDCGRLVSAPQLGNHRRLTHGVTNTPTPPAAETVTVTITPNASAVARPASVPAAVAERAIATADQPTILACTECDWEIDYQPGAARDLSRHTIADHRRGPTSIERNPLPKGGPT